MSVLTPQILSSAVVSDRPLPVIEARNMSKSIDDRIILHPLNFAIQPGSYVALLGANGAGKSTLMKVLSTLSSPSAGELLLFGQSLHRDASHLRRRIGLISHQAMLYRDLSPRENLVFFGKLYGVTQPAERAEQLLTTVGLAHRADDPVKDFSRGMVQRVTIARALMHDPDLLLADEPFAGLDAPSIDCLEHLLAQLHVIGKTILLANHDIAQSLRLADHLLLLRHGRLALNRPTTGLDVATVLAEVTP